MTNLTTSMGLPILNEVEIDFAVDFDSESCAIRNP